MWGLGLENNCLWFLDTGVIIGEDLIEGHSWTTGVVLLVPVGVGLHGCVCAVFDPHLPTGNVHVTREEPEVAWQPRGTTLRSMRNEIINHSSATKKDVDSLTVFWRSAWAADDVEHAEFSCCRGLQVAMATCAILIRALEARPHPHSGPQQTANRKEWRREERACEVFNAHELDYRSCKISWGS